MRKRYLSVTIDSLTETDNFHEALGFGMSNTAISQFCVLDQQTGECIVIREGYRGNDLICATINRSTNEVEVNQLSVSVLGLNELQIDEIKRRLIKYKDRIIEMHLKHEYLHVPVRMDK